MEHRNVYMDYNATTPIHPEVKKVMIESLDIFGNGSSMHGYGREAGMLIAKAREQIAHLINADPGEIIFTAGGSESDNTVLKYVGCQKSSCVAKEYCSRCVKNEIITTPIEHPAILETVKFLNGSGINTRFMKVDSTGLVNPEELYDLITDKTALVSVMAANNEIGTLQDIKRIAQICHEKGVLFHTDAVQAIGKIPIDVKAMGIDYLSMSGHKIYAPKGIGILYARKGAPYCPFVHGGHQEAGRRAGTMNTTGIVSLGKAAELAEKELASESARLLKLRNKLKAGIIATIPDIKINGNQEHTLPNTLNVSFTGAEGESILLYMDLDGIAVSTGSACSTGSLEPSHVLMATGVDAELAHGSIRFSLGRENTEEDIDYVLEKLPPIIERIRKMSTVYKKGETK